MSSLHSSTDIITMATRAARASVTPRLAATLSLVRVKGVCGEAV